MKMHLCGGCRQSYPRTSEFFHVARGRSDGLASRCKVCMRAATKPHTERRRAELKAQREFAIASFAAMKAA